MNRHEEQIVRVLANSVRVMTIVQIASTWWTDTRWGRDRASAAMKRAGLGRLAARAAGAVQTRPIVRVAIDRLAAREAAT